VVGKGHLSLLDTTLDEGEQIEKSGCGSGCPPDVAATPRRQARRMSRYLLHHHHESDECGVAFAAFRGFESRLRHQTTLASCRSGGHSIWWTVEASSEDDALALLPFFIAERTTVTPVGEVQIP
jgi:hypothetical protein